MISLNVGCRAALVTGAMLFASDACAHVPKGLILPACLPMKEKKYLNTLPLRLDSVLDSSGCDGGVLHAKSDRSMKDHAKSVHWMIT